MLFLVHGEKIIAATCFSSFPSKRYDVKLGKENVFLSKKHTLRHCLFKTKIRLFCKYDIWENGAITGVKTLLKWFDFLLLGSSLAAVLFLMRRFEWSAVLPAKKPAEYRHRLNFEKNREGIVGNKFICACNVWSHITAIKSNLQVNCSLSIQ